LKHTVADPLRTEIVAGHSSRVERIVERFGAQEFGVAQASISEALNNLERDGCVTKESGQRARVIHLSGKGFAQIYDVGDACEASMLILRPSPKWRTEASIRSSTERIGSRQTTTRTIWSTTPSNFTSNFVGSLSSRFLVAVRFLLLLRRGAG
jgi:DNA-binding PadR family transcriptional regulator